MTTAEEDENSTSLLHDRSLGEAPFSPMSTTTRGFAEALFNGTAITAKDVPGGRAYAALRQLCSDHSLHSVDDLIRAGSDVEAVAFAPLDRLVSPEELPSIRAAVESVLPTGQFTSGAHVDALESEISELLNVGHVLGASSGTDAMIVTLLALGAGPDTEVIIPANSFAATENAVYLTGARPVLVDTHEDDYLVDPDEVASLITDRTVCVLPVHLYGKCANVRALAQVCTDYGVALVEDACQGIGLDDVGLFSDAAILSFNPYKNLGAAGKAGAVATKHAHMATRVTELLYHGFTPGRKNVKSSAYGLNARLDNLQAAILRTRLEWLGLNNLKRSVLARRYIEGLSDAVDRGALRTPGWNHVDHVWHLFTVEVLDRDRDAVREELHTAGIATDLYYPVLTHRHHTAAAETLVPNTKIPRTESSHNKVFQLPLFPELTLAEQDRVIEGLLHALD